MKAFFRVGSGTGIFTRCLLKHEKLGSSVGKLIAVEPSSGMRDQFEVGLDDNRVSCQSGTFEKTDVDDQWADVIFVAQAWHWCPDYDKALVLHCV